MKSLHRNGKKSEEAVFKKKNNTHTHNHTLTEITAVA